MWSLTISPAIATATAEQQAREAIGSARRAREARWAVDGRRGPSPRRAHRSTRPWWTRSLVGRAAH